MSLQIYTDGSSGKDGSGGWGFVIVKDDVSILTMSGYATETTNNRMELMGPIMAIKHMPKDVKVEIVSDSAYVVNCFLDSWHVKWKQNDWIGSAGTEVKNKDLWEQLLSIALKDNITWRHVKGHRGDKWNEICDVLAHEARMRAVALIKSRGVVVNA